VQGLTPVLLDIDFTRQMYWVLGNDCVAGCVQREVKAALGHTVHVTRDQTLGSKILTAACATSAFAVAVFFSPVLKPRLCLGLNTLGQFHASVQRTPALTLVFLPNSAVEKRFGHLSNRPRPWRGVPDPNNCCLQMRLSAGSGVLHSNVSCGDQYDEQVMSVLWIAMLSHGQAAGSAAAVLGQQSRLIEMARQYCLQQLASFANTSLHITMHRQHTPTQHTPSHQWATGTPPSPLPPPLPLPTLPLHHHQSL
jgi:hypothetical protein